MVMNAEEKKRTANERRLKAVQEWKNRNQQSIKVEAKPVRVNFEDLPEKNTAENKLTLFNSDEEDNFENDFHIRPQFEGERGQQLLELNSELSSRFKLDERFKEDDDLLETNATEVKNEEKIKNIKILESILGYEVAEKFPEGKSSIKKKRLMRFDPEDESASKYIKTNDFSEQPATKIQKKKVKEELNEEKQEIPVSSERYIEVSSNLKDLLSSSSTSFSLSQKFSNVADNDSNTGFSFSFGTKEDSQSKQAVPNDTKEEIKTPTVQQQRNIFENREKFLFFVAEHDDKLKEGVEFFKRTRTLEEIYEDWNIRKAEVLELFRRKRKSSQRGFVTRIKASEKNKAYAKK